MIKTFQSGAILVLDFDNGLAVRAIPQKDGSITASVLLPDGTLTAAEKLGADGFADFLSKVSRRKRAKKTVKKI